MAQDEEGIRSPYYILDFHRINRLFRLCSVADLPDVLPSILISSVIPYVDDCSNAPQLYLKRHQ